MLIDFTSTPPVATLSKSAPHLSNYRRIYGSAEKVTAEEGLRKVGPEALAKYLATYDELGFDHVLVKARDLETTFGLKIWNEDVAAFCREQGPRFIGFAGVDPHKGMAAIRELEHAVRELGLRGLNLQCFEHKLAINDRKMFPLYAKCIELGIPVNVHCGINFSTDSLVEYGRPTLIDDVMTHFPELRLCAAPPGWPWVHELIGIAWRHPNVWIGLVFMRPKYLAVAGSGYEGLLQYGASLLQDRMIFGSGFPSLPVKRSLEEIAALPLDEAVRAKWLGGNAARYLGLGAENGRPA